MNRDQLITDWQQRLASAEAEPVSASPRRAWLVRVRTRLYRFLLSLYGDGRWRSVDPRSRSASPDVAIEAVRYAGKPAKDLGKIRAVLKTVSSAQDVRQETGPLAEGLSTGEWIVVASQLNDLDLKECSRLLSINGVVSRWVEDDRNSAILVPSLFVKQACELVDVNRRKLRPRPAPLPVVVRSSEPPSLRFLFLATSPLLILFSILLTVGTYSDPPQNEVGAAIIHCLAIFATLSALFFGVRLIGNLIQFVERRITHGFYALGKWLRSRFGATRRSGQTVAD